MERWNPVIEATWAKLGLVALIAGVVALVLEFMGLAKPNDSIPPLTQLVVSHVPIWVTMTVCMLIAGFGIWLVYHFWLSYAHAGL